MHMHEDKVPFGDWISSLINNATAQHLFVAVAGRDCVCVFLNR